MDTTTAPTRRRKSRRNRPAVAPAAAKVGDVIYVATYDGPNCITVSRRVVTRATGKAVRTTPAGNFATTDGWPIGPAIRRTEPPAPIGPLRASDQRAIERAIEAEPHRLAPRQTIRAIGPDTHEAQVAAIRTNHSREIRVNAKRTKRTLNRHTVAA